MDSLLDTSRLVLYFLVGLTIVGGIVYFFYLAWSRWGEGGADESSSDEVSS